MMSEVIKLEFAVIYLDFGAKQNGCLLSTKLSKYSFVLCVVKFAVIKCRQTLARLGESFTKHPRPLPIISTTIGIKRLRTVALKTFKCSSPPQKNVSNVTSSKQDPNFLTKKERERISVMFRIPSILGFNNFEPRPYTLAIYVE